MASLCATKQVDKVLCKELNYPTLYLIRLGRCSLTSLQNDLMLLAQKGTSTLWKLLPTNELSNNILGCESLNLDLTVCKTSDEARRDASGCMTSPDQRPP